MTGILAEFDALPGVSQEAVPEKKERAGPAAVHACGHNLFGAASIQAAIAVKDWLRATGGAGTVRVYGSPAEEGGSGKVYLVRAGLFRDVDAAVHWHPADRNVVMMNPSLSNRSGKFRFRGVASHASSAPERGRSALDGVEAMNHMVNLLREHVPETTRIHYVITRGGEAPNVVPAFAEDVPVLVDKARNSSHPVYLRLGKCERPQDFTLPVYKPWRRLIEGDGPTVVVVGPLVAAGLNVVVDHFGRPDPGQGQPSLDPDQAAGSLPGGAGSGTVPGPHRRSPRRARSATLNTKLMIPAPKTR